MGKIKVVIEAGEKKRFASALDWPGWSRIGVDEKSALENLAAYAGRYQRAISSAKIDFQPPRSLEEFNIIERVSGGKTTDFGVPAAPAKAENAPLNAAELKRLEALLKANWDYFDSVIKAKAGHTLRKGPRGGGRTLEQIIGHVLDAHSQAYLPKINWREKIEPEPDAGKMIKKLEEIDHKALAMAVSGKMPAKGPRSGTFWTPRYFIRRAAWHILDHAWEIEDKAEG